jgi:hypothetical protein
VDQIADSFMGRPDAKKVAAGFMPGSKGDKEFTPDSDLKPFQYKKPLASLGATSFMPSDHPDAIKEAAIKMKDGRIFTGATHAQAWLKARKDGAKEADYPETKDGFVTKTGTFLNREEAAAHAAEIGQVEKNSSSAKKNAGGVESLQFQEDRKFMPGTKEEPTSNVSKTKEKFVVGTVYEDDQSNRARYKGNGQWEELVAK